MFTSAYYLYQPIRHTSLLTYPIRCLTTTQISGTGNPFETKIKRKREVADITKPNFEKVECLKWANWRMVRDVKRRYQNAWYWQYRMNLKNISNNNTLPNLIRDIASEDRNACPRDSSVCQFVNRCSITSRARGNLTKYRISRIVWRDLADHGLLSGPIRAKWG